MTADILARDRSGNADLFHEYLRATRKLLLAEPARSRVWVSMISTDSFGGVRDVLKGWTPESRGVFSGTSTDMVYNLGAQTETWVSGSAWVRGQIYSGGLNLGVYDQSAGTTYFNHRDWLGTLRAQSNMTGGTQQTCTSLPFGDSQTCSPTDISKNTLHFTDQEFDIESNLSHFLFRNYAPTQGRWITPDPAGLRAARSNAPQTWDRYGYVENHVVLVRDPLGLDDGPYCIDQNGNHIPIIEVRRGRRLSPHDGVLDCNSLTVVTVSGGTDDGSDSIVSFDGFYDPPAWLGNGGAGCIEGNVVLDAQIALLTPVAQSLNQTVGVGIGGSLAAGTGIVGFSGSASSQLLVDPNGKAAIATTIGGVFIGFPVSAATYGAGFIWGLQLSSSTGTSVDDSEGISIDAGAAAAGTEIGPALGYDVAAGANASGPVVQQTVTLGLGAGGFSKGASAQRTFITHVCQ